MAVTLADIKKLRDLTGAGMMDVKKALEEANGDFEVARDLLRKRGQAIAAKRSDRQASEGCVLGRAENGYGAIVAVKCETDFVAKNADFVAMVKLILDIAMDQRPADLEALKNTVVDGKLTVNDLVTERSGVTGEKMELSDYVFLAAPKVDAYNHLGNKLSALVGADSADADMTTVHGISMQVASMAPIALDADHVAQEVKDHELAVAVDKTKQDEIAKAVENALRKAGINPAHADSEEHIESNTAKGWLTPEQAQQARDIRATVPAEAEAQLNMKKIEMIAQGRLGKFLKESTLVEQAYIMSESKELVKDVLKKNNVTITDFKRVTLNEE